MDTKFKLVSESIVHPKTGQALMRVMMDLPNGKQTRRTVTLEDYLKLFQSSIYLERLDDGVVVNKELIPRGFLGGHFATNGSYTCVFERKGKIEQLVLDQVGHFYVPYPDLVFVLRYDAEKKHFPMKRVYAKDGEELYYYPFANVAQSGEICLGSIRPGITPEEFAEDFILGVTNNDFYDGWNATHISMEWSQHELAKKLEQEDRFPTKWLVPLDKTVTELVNEFVKEKKEDI